MDKMRVFCSIFEAVLVVVISPLALGADFQSMSLGTENSPQVEAKLIEQKIQQGDKIYLLARDLGGVSKLGEFFGQPDKGNVERVLASYGVKYVNLNDAGPKTEYAPATEAAPAAAGSLSDCLPYYQPQFRGLVFQIGAQTLTIDPEGRAGIAVWTGGPGAPPIPGIRTSCQGTVGGWGNPSDQGGHLIPVALGGSPYRLNLTPQDGILNIGVWAQDVEDVAIFCRQYGDTSYTVAPVYPDTVALRPIGYLAELTVLVPANKEKFTVGQVSIPNRPLTADESKAASDFHWEYKYMCTLKQK